MYSVSVLSKVSGSKKKIINNDAKNKRLIYARLLNALI